MRLGFTPFRGSNPRASAAHRPLPQSTQGRGQTHDRAKVAVGLILGLATLIATLKAAFIRGRLTRDELDLRVGQTLGSRTYAELAAITADLPAEVAAAQSARIAARPRDLRSEKAAKTAACAGLALVLLAVAAFLGPGSGPERLVGLALFFLPICAASVGRLLMLHAWLEKRSRGQLPQGPAPGATGPAAQRPDPLAGAGPPPQIEAG
jgi:DUF1707 SHOCT-like domain